MAEKKISITFFLHYIKDIQNQKIPQIIHIETIIKNRYYQVLKVWAPVRVMKNGNWKTEWICPGISTVRFLNKLQKCCFTCRKHFIDIHKHHCFLIPHDIDI